MRAHVHAQPYTGYLNFFVCRVLLPTQEKRMPYTVFQPLYIYGPHTAKDCEQWFIDRIAR